MPGQLVEGSTHRISLGARIIMVAIVSAMIAVLVTALVAYPLVRDAAEQEAQFNLGQLADATAGAIEARPDRSTLLVPPRLHAVLLAEEIAVYIVRPGRPVPSFVTPADLSAVLAGHAVSGRAMLDSGPIIYAARMLANGSVVVLSQPSDPFRGIMGQAVNRMGLALAAGVGIAALIGSLLARRSAAPLRAASAAAERLSRGDRDVALSLDGPREIYDVNRALAGLQSELAISEGRLREFLMSVSHELRTPLTGIRGYAEALGDGVISDPVDIQRSGRVVVEEADRLDRLVSDLLDLARIDARDFVIVPQEADFAEIASQAADVWSDRCRAAGVDFELRSQPGPVRGSTDAVRVRQIIDNLVANALRVTPAGRQIVLELRTVGQFVVVEVRDSGPGLTPDDCAVAFQPGELYNRYRGLRQVGTGVGLALVGRLAFRLGGSAQAGEAVEGGAAFTVTLARDLSSPGLTLDR
ncbi:MAG: HAMP domain-containing sensor histidine kinase [Candidatus Nanopelagicales bacterium]|nr:HAMP domain-containing sensor histidine kinase [Candidatus Nanopelagicales bacterium]